MSWTPVVSTKTNGTSAAVDTTGAKLIVIMATSSGAPTITDSKSNIWTLATGGYTSGTPNLRVYYCISPTVGTGHTFSIAGSVPAMVVHAVTSTNTPALDSTSTANQTSSTQGQIGSVSFTPATSGCIVYAGTAFPGAITGWAAGSGWTGVDLQNYVSGTSFGVGMSYKAQTTATAIPTSEATQTWTGSATNSYFGVAFKEVVPGGTLSITTPVTLEVHQRSGTTGSIQITGTHSGATEDIEASFNGGAFQTIATAVAAGNFSGTLTGQAQGQGTLTVRKKTTTSASATVADIGIGDVFVVGGDSISEGRGDNAQSFSHATLKATVFRQDNAWKLGNDAADTGTSVGSHWPLLATLLMADQGVPVAFITTGEGGTDVAGTNNTWAKNNSQYAGMVTTVTNSTATGVKAALFQLGPNAVANGNNAAIPLATYQTALATLATNIAADVPGAPPLMVGLFGQMTTASPPDRRTAEDNIRGAILAAAAAGSIKMGPNLVGATMDDGVHPKADAKLLLLAQRWYVAMKEQLYGGSSGYGRGPRIVSSTWNVARTQLTVVFDRALKTGLTHSAGAWIVRDNGSAMTVSSVAYHGSNANALLLNVSAAATGPADTTTVTFASGEDATGLVIPQSADITLPVLGPVQIPAEPFYAYSVSENANLATTVTVTLTLDGATPAANLTGLRWAFFDQTSPHLFTAPIVKGNTGTTNGSGVFTTSISGTALQVGQTGWLVVTNSDGTTTQNPSGKVADGPVATS